MKKVLLFFFAAFAILGCEKPVIAGDHEEVSSENSKTKNFTFTVKGDFGEPTFIEGGKTRGYLQADGAEMTDLWVFDYMDGVCVQQLHQSNGESDWGSPRMQLKYGSHHIYFVASMGDTPTLESGGISWATTKDTFWQDYEVTVTASSNGNRAVTLDRVATKLRIIVNDEVPEGCTQLVITPTKWYYGLNYFNGDPTNGKLKDRTVAIPESYVGTSGRLAVSVYGMSGTEEWTTDVQLTAKDDHGNILGSVTIQNAPFKRNRSTEYSGMLFSGKEIDVDLNATWEESYTGEF